MDAGNYHQDRKTNPRETANFLSKLTFWYIRGVFLTGRRGELSIDSLYRCTDEHKSSPRGDVLAQVWKQQLDNAANRKPSLLKSILSVYGVRYFTVNAFYLIFDMTMKLSMPLFLGRLIDYFSPTSKMTKNEAWLYACCVVGCMLFAATGIHTFLLWVLHLSMKARLACCSLIYRKLLRLDLTAGGKATEGLTGHVVTLLTTDALLFDTCALFLTDLAMGPVQSVIIMYLMYRQMGYATLIGCAFLLSFIPLQGYLSKVSAKLRRKVATRTDHRIRLMNEILQGIQAVKMYAWEDVFAKIIGKARRKEMNVIKKMSWLRAVMLACMKLNTKVSIFISVLCYIYFGHNVTASKIFVMFSYYDILRLVIVDFFPMAISYTLQAHVSVKRMQEFLLLPEVDNKDGIDLTKIDGKHVEGYYEEKEIASKMEKGLIRQFSNPKIARNESNGTLAKRHIVLVSFKDATAHWRGSGDEQNQDENLKGIEEVVKLPIALENINLSITSGTLTAIVGTVGSGKTSMLLAILRELPISTGHLLVEGNVAYASQDAWLFDGSVRQNILFGRDMNPKRYRQVLKCCQLQRDLEILPHGDKTIVGERGSSLSGGQRARVSLARCVYQNADLYLLDDPLAAVDSKVAQAIYDECVRGFLKDKAIVLVTHHLHFTRHADKICVMRNGQITALGTYQELQASQSGFACLQEVEENHKTESKEADGKPPHEIVKEAIKPRRTMSMTSQTSLVLDLECNITDPKVEGEQQQSGTVGWGVYASYIKGGGNTCSMLALFALFTVAQACLSASDYWLKEWVNLEEAYSIYTTRDTNTSFERLVKNSTLANDAIGSNHTNAMINSNLTDVDVNWSWADLPSNTWHLTRQDCLYVYAGLVGICVLLTWNKLVLFYTICIKSSINLHDSMFRGVTCAPMWFFNHNPSGRILNRFAKDMGQVDTLLPVALVDCLGFFLEVLFILIVVCLVNWWLLFPTGVIVVLLNLLRNFFLNTSRELKRIEAIARSQSLNHASATVSGLSTIRSSGNRQILLAREFDRFQDLHSSSWTLVLSTTRAFGLWMDMICCTYLAVVTFSFLILPTENTFGGNVGLAITQVIGLVGMCQYGLRQTAEVENQMTSVERINEYSNLPSEKPLESDETLQNTKYPGRNLKAWPEKGELTFKDISIEYEKPPKRIGVKKPKGPTSVANLAENEERTYAIRNVNLTLKAGEKVAVVGRTGAGKSTLIAALFRLARLEGTILIDGVDCHDVGLRQWRSGIAALPQQPAIFAGTLRHNIDPRGSHSDNELWEALNEVELKPLVRNLPGGLSTNLGDSGGNLSAGQRQLLCLARAVLSRAKVLILDEATASVDTETDKLIQDTIRRKFADTTVLTIAHRLNTVMDYDRVIVMDQGRVVEMGHPYELLSNTTQNQANDSEISTRNQQSKPVAPLAVPEITDVNLGQAGTELGPVGSKSGPIETELGQLETKLDQLDEVELEFDQVEIEMGPLETKSGPVESELGPVETILGPVETESGPVETTLGPVDTESVPVEAELGPVETGLGPAEIELGPIEIGSAETKLRLKDQLSTEFGQISKDGAVFINSGKNSGLIGKNLSHLGQDWTNFGQNDRKYGHVGSNLRIETSQSRENMNLGFFKSLVEQTGGPTANLLYKMAEESYKKKLDLKKTL